MLSRLPVHMQNRHTVQIRFRNIFLAKEPPFQSRFDFNIEIEIRHLQILIITLRLSLCFNHIASCRKSRYHCPCHKSDKKTSRHTLFQETAGGYSASAVLYSYNFFSNSATHSKCRGTTPLMSEVFNFFVFRNYPQNRFEGSCPLVFFSPINWELMIYFYPKYGITD